MSTVSMKSKSLLILVRSVIVHNLSVHVIPKTIILCLIIFSERFNLLRYFQKGNLTFMSHSKSLCLCKGFTTDCKLIFYHDIWSSVCMCRSQTYSNSLVRSHYLLNNVCHLVEFCCMGIKTNVPLRLRAGKRGRVACNAHFTLTWIIFILNLCSWVDLFIAGSQ